MTIIHDVTRNCATAVTGIWAKGLRHGIDRTARLFNSSNRHRQLRRPTPTTAKRQLGIRGGRDGRVLWRAGANSCRSVPVSVVHRRRRRCWARGDGRLRLPRRLAPLGVAAQAAGRRRRDAGCGSRGVRGVHPPVAPLHQCDRGRGVAVRSGDSGQHGGERRCASNPERHWPDDGLPGSDVSNTSRGSDAGVDRRLCGTDSLSFT